MKRNIFINSLLGGLFLLAGCTPGVPRVDAMLEQVPSIFPDYEGVTIPCNVAPLRFMLTESNVEEAVAVIVGAGQKLVVQADGELAFSISEEEWKDLLAGAVGDSLTVEVYARRGHEWVGYRHFAWHVSSDEIDPFLVYRLIEPGYVLWNRMGIYQRDLTSYEEEALLTNDFTGYNCMNCHTFSDRNPDKMLFHMRDKFGGTYMVSHDTMEKLDNIEVNGKPQSLVYPSWHSSGRYIAFSLNQTKQAFHRNDRNRIEVLDLASDVVVYDVEKRTFLKDSLLMGAAAFETFPSFSSDGKTLYFCSAAAQVMPQDFDKVKYSLCAISFDADKGQLGTQVDTLYNSRTEGGSVSFPRQSPDGRFLAFTVSGYGNFSIWHKDADLWLMDLATKEMRPLSEVNSEDVESYHSWSSNGRWLVFSSRRGDGLYTRPYLVHVDGEGHCSKPFALPQGKASFYKNVMYSFNIPELVKGKVELDKRQFQRFVNP